MAMARAYVADAKESSAIDFVAADVRSLKQKSERENKASVVVVSRDWRRV